MSSRIQVLAIAFILALSGLLLIWYKVTFLSMPLTPYAQKFYYTLSAEISFKGTDAPAEISVALPKSQEGIRVVSQETEAGDFGYTISQTTEGERGVWSKRKVTGKEKIFYKVTVLPEIHYGLEKGEEKDTFQATKREEIEPGSLFALWEDPQRNAALHLIESAKTHSSNAVTFTAQLISRFNEKEPEESVKALLSIRNETKVSLITKMLSYEKITYRKIRGIYLQDGQKNRQLTPMLEVQSESGKWEFFDYEWGHSVQPKDFFIWHRGNEALFITQGVQKPKLRFSVTKTLVPVSSSMEQDAYASGNEFLNFSLFTLPGSQQNAFKQILLVPIGVLIVVVLRILVGIRTMGTFMPVLFALTFIQTTLLNGLIMFFVIVFSGLMIRFYLSKLRLLLVARISAVIIVVIAIMSFMSVLSYKLGLTEALNVTFFPMIILSWTIERMSILWEEEGGHEVLVQGMGSLTVAVLAYFAMMNVYVAHLFFNFPELLLVVLSLIILIGRYTGYRITELLRFAPLGR